MPVRSTTSTATSPVIIRTKAVFVSQCSSGGVGGFTRVAITCSPKEKVRSPRETRRLKAGSTECNAAAHRRQLRSCRSFCASFKKIKAASIGGLNPTVRQGSDPGFPEYTDEDRLAVCRGRRTSGPCLIIGCRAVARRATTRARGGWASNLNSGDAGHPDEHAECGRLIGSRGGVLSDCGSCYSEPYDNEDRHSADGLHAALLWSKPRHCGVNRTPRPARKFHTTTDPFVRCSLERAGVFPHTISRSSASTRALRRRFPNDHYRRFDTRLLWRQ